MRSILLFLLTILFASPARAQQQEHPFLYPVPPENLETLQERTSYLVEHFWERCNMKSIFSSLKNFDRAFEDYISFTPYADSTVVFNSVDRLIKEVKKNPTNMATLARTARAKLYSDSAEIRWDALYLPFAKAAAATSGISKAERAMYELEASQLENSRPGVPIPDFTMTLADGSHLDMKDVKGNYILIFFDDPDDFENMLARARLSTDYSLNDLIGRGQVTVISLYPGAADDQWRSRTESYPSNWIVAASDQTERLFDRRVKPTFYYLNKNHIILSNTLQADGLVDAFRSALATQNLIKSERERLRQEALKKKLEEENSRTSD